MYRRTHRAKSRRSYLPSRSHRVHRRHPSTPQTEDFLPPLNYNISLPRPKVVGQIPVGDVHGSSSRVKAAARHLRSARFSSGIKPYFNVLRFSGYKLQDYSKKSIRNISPFKRIPVNYTALPDNHTVVVLTADGKRIPLKLKNTMLLLSLYQRELHIRTVMVTSSDVVANFALSLHMNVIPVPEVNPFGMPILKSFLIDVRRKFKAKQYFYINSDILLNPAIFSVARSLDEHFNGNNYFLASTVYETNRVPSTLVLSSVQAFKDFYSKLYGIRRNPNAVDVFVFPYSYPFESLAPIVIGRWHVDYGVMVTTHKLKMEVVDLTLVISAHQGRDSAGVTFRRQSNGMWNFQFYREKDGKIGLMTANYLVV